MLEGVNLLLGISLGLFARRVTAEPRWKQPRSWPWARGATLVRSKVSSACPLRELTMPCQAISIALTPIAPINIRVKLPY